MQQLLVFSVHWNNLFTGLLLHINWHSRLDYRAEGSLCNPRELLGGLWQQGELCCEGTETITSVEAKYLLWKWWHLKYTIWIVSGFNCLRPSGWEGRTWAGRLCGHLTWTTLEAPSVQMVHTLWSTTCVTHWVRTHTIHKDHKCLRHCPTTTWTFNIQAFSLLNVCYVLAGFPPKPTTTVGPTTTADPITTFCRGRPDGLYPNSADETTYFQCFRGNTYLHSCQPGLVFLDACKCCDYP